MMIAKVNRSIHIGRGDDRMIRIRTKSLDGQEGIGDLGVLLLRSASGAPDLTRVLLEGLQVELQVAARA